VYLDADPATAHRRLQQQHPQCQLSLAFMHGYDDFLFEMAIKRASLGGLIVVKWDYYLALQISTHEQIHLAQQQQQQQQQQSSSSSTREDSNNNSNNPAIKVARDNQSQQLTILTDSLLHALVDVERTHRRPARVVYQPALTRAGILQLHHQQKASSSSSSSSSSSASSSSLLSSSAALQKSSTSQSNMLMNACVYCSVEDITAAYHAMFSTSSSSSSSSSSSAASAAAVSAVTDSQGRFKYVDDSNEIYIDIRLWMLPDNQFKRVVMTHLSYFQTVTFFGRDVDNESLMQWLKE
jgi:hypothetical protein